MVYEIQSATLINAIARANGKTGLVTHTYITTPTFMQRIIKWMVR